MTIDWFQGESWDYLRTQIDTRLAQPTDSPSIDAAMAELFGEAARNGADPFQLTPGAAHDIQTEIQYLLRDWGPNEVGPGLDFLRKNMAAVAAGEGPFKDATAFYPGLRLAWSDYSLIFCLPRPGEPALIAAILRYPNDVLRQLYDRVG